MFGALFKIPEEELDKALERVLSHVRVEAFVERIARKVTEMLLTQLIAGLRDEDRESDGAVSA